jgi:hypothetical protein
VVEVYVWKCQTAIQSVKLRQASRGGTFDATAWPNHEKEAGSSVEIT